MPRGPCVASEPAVGAGLRVPLLSSTLACPERTGRAQPTPGGRGGPGAGVPGAGQGGPEPGASPRSGTQAGPGQAGCSLPGQHTACVTWAASVGGMDQAEGAEERRPSSVCRALCGSACLMGWELGTGSRWAVEPTGCASPSVCGQPQRHGPPCLPLGHGHSSRRGSSSRVRVPKPV